MEPQTQPVPAETTVPNPNPIPTQSSDNQAEEKGKAPLLVIIISWLLLLSGVIGLLDVIFTPTLGFVSAYFLMGMFGMLALVPILINILHIVVSFGLRKMKKWALYVVTAGTIISILSSISYFSELSVQIVIGLNLAIMAYFWTIREKFV